MTVSIEYAAAHLKELFAAADAGESVSIERVDGPPMGLHPRPLAARTKAGNRVLGAGAGEMGSVSWEDWQRIDREWKKSFLDEADVD